MRTAGMCPRLRLVDCARTSGQVGMPTLTGWGTSGRMVATPEPPPASSPDSLQGLYAHFIGGKRVQPDGAPDLVRNNPASSDQVLGGMRSADLDLAKTPVRLPPEPWP